MQGVVPLNLRVDMTVAPNPQTASCDLELRASSKNCCIAAVVVTDLDGGLFDNRESLLCCPAEPAPACTIPLQPTKHSTTNILVQVGTSMAVSPTNPRGKTSVGAGTACRAECMQSGASALHRSAPCSPVPSPSVTCPLRPPLRLLSKRRQPRLGKVHVGQRASSTQLGVLELQHTLPKFCMFQAVADDASAPRPHSAVNLTLREMPRRVFAWVQEAFIVPADLVTSLSPSPTGAFPPIVFDGIYSGEPHPIWIEVCSVRERVVCPSAQACNCSRSRRSLTTGRHLLAFFLSSIAVDRTALAGRLCDRSTAARQSRSPPRTWTWRRSWCRTWPSSSA